MSLMQPPWGSEVAALLEAHRAGEYPLDQMEDRLTELDEADILTPAELREQARLGAALETLYRF